MTTVIKIENLHKEYRLGTIGYGTLREDLQSWWARINGKPDPNSIIGHKVGQNMKSDRILALNDINLEIKRGELLGIIGKNGAGKTTLLKILSRIASPTKGSVKIKGRIASLIAVGTGFHGELTGRENIYLNGSILGLREFEIDQRFDEIVDFSGVEQFIDTPVKRYSSGMYIRLGFAVAAHLDPDVLIVDEVLSVGDIEFQKKAIGKMQNVSSKEGRTVLFVSHNMVTISNLCKRVILLSYGKVVADGQVNEIVQKYISNEGTKGGEIEWPEFKDKQGIDIAKLKSVKIFQDGIIGPTADVDISKEIHIEITYSCLMEGAELYSGIWLKDGKGVFVLSSSNHPSISLTRDSWYGSPHSIGLYKSICIIPGNFLNSGRYLITPIVGQVPNTTIMLEEGVISFDVHDTGAMQKEVNISWDGPVIRPRLAWNTEKFDLNTLL